LKSSFGGRFPQWRAEEGFAALKIPFGVLKRALEFDGIFTWAKAKLASLPFLFLGVFREALLADVKSIGPTGPREEQT
jgi:hypothetical protein